MLKSRAQKKGGSVLEKKLKQLEKVANEPSKVRVGVPDNSVNYPDGTSLLMVAATNEFGSARAGVPERSFLRSTVINSKRKFRKFWRAKKAAGLLLAEDSASKVLNLLGQLAETEVKKTITQLNDPANAQSTIDRKRSSNPLINTGLLRQSIRYEVDES